MIIDNIDMLVTNADLKKGQDNSDYCLVGLLSLDDGQKYDVIVRDPEKYFQLKPLTKITLNLQITNGKYGIKLYINDIVNIGEAI